RDPPCRRLRSAPVAGRLEEAWGLASEVVVRPRAPDGTAISLSATFSITPPSASITTRLEPPELISGSGTPVSGSTPSTAPRLTNAWPATRQVAPATRYLPNGSLQRIAIRNPRTANGATGTRDDQG